MKDEMLQAFAGKYIVTHTYGSDYKSDPELASILDITEEEVRKKREEEALDIVDWQVSHSLKIAAVLLKSYDLTREQFMKFCEDYNLPERMIRILEGGDSI